jgi:hypothetical protein
VDVEAVISAEEIRVEPGTFRCRAWAPSGARAQATVTLTDGLLRHARIAQMFTAHGAGDLLIGAPPTREVRDSAWRPTMCGWRDGSPVSPGGFDRPGTGDGGILDVLRLRTHLESIQLWSRGGPSVVSAIPDQATLYPLAAPAGSERNIRVAVLGGDLECAAYWAFFRNSVPEASFELGRSIAALDADAEVERAVVAAHFVINFGIDDTPLTERIASRLAAAGPSSDAKVMLWALAFEGRWGDYERDGTALFQEAADTLYRNTCLYTATLRTFVERYASALPGGGEDAQNAWITEPIAWIRRLVMATFWDGDYLSYRASEPRNPDPKATDATVGDLAKKKICQRPLNS